MRYSIGLHGSRWTLRITAIIMLIAGGGLSSKVIAQTSRVLVWNADAATYAGYNVFQCVSAIERLKQEARRVPDTSRFTPQMNAGVRVIQDAARRCRSAGQWTANTIDPRGLYPLLQLYAEAGDTVASGAVAARMLALTRTLEERAERLYGILGIYVVARPINWSAIDSTLTRLDALAGGAGDELIQGGYRDLIFLSMLDHLTDDRALFGYIDRAAKVATRMHGAPRDGMTQLLAFVRGQLELMTADSLLINGAPMTVSPLNGDLVVGNGVYPTPHKITVIMPVNSAREARPTVAALRRLKKKFGDTVETVIITRTYGYFDWRARLTAIDEEQVTRRFYVDTLQTNSAVLIEETPTQYRPEPDGRIVYGVTDNAKRYAPLQGMVVDANGRLQNAGFSWTPYEEIRIEQAIARAIKRSGY